MTGPTSEGNAYIACSAVKVEEKEKNKDKVVTEKGNGIFSIQEAQNEQEIKLTPGKLTDKFKGADNYAKALKKQKEYKTKARSEETERE